MATGLPARVVLVCAVICAVIAHAPLGDAAPEEPEATAAVAPTAKAPARRPVAVIDLSGDTAAEELANALYNILINHVDLRPVNPNFIRPLKGTFADEEQPAIELAERAKQEANDLLVALEFRSAESAAERGMKGLLDVRPTPEVLGLYAELAFATGQAALKQRRPNDASLAFALSHRLDPAKRPDPTRYEPEIVEAYQQAASKVEPPAKLEVRGSGSVWIDGVDRGVAPGTFDISGGLHLVQLTGPERETRGKQVSLPQTLAIEIDAAPASDERKVERARIELARTQDAAARAGGVKRLAMLLGVGDAVLIEKSADGTLRVQTWRDRAPGFSAMVDAVPDRPADLLLPLAPPRVEPKPKPEPPRVQLPVVVDTPLIRKRWFQGAVATGVLAIAATIYIVASQDRMVPIEPDVKPVGQ